MSLKKTALFAALAALLATSASAASDDYAARVARILKTTPLIDGHNDWPEVLREREGEGRWTLDLTKGLDIGDEPETQPDGVDVPGNQLHGFA